MAGKSYQNEHDAKSASEAADKSLELILYKNLHDAVKHIVEEDRHEIADEMVEAWQAPSCPVPEAGSRHGRLHPVHCRRPNALSP